MEKRLRHLEIFLSDYMYQSLNINLLKFEHLNIKNEMDILLLGKEIATFLPTNLIDALKEISRDNSNISSLIVHNLPVEKINKFSEINMNSKLILAALTHIIGHAFVAPDHREGKILQDLIPKKDDIGKQLGTGTELEWHTEDAHLLHPARFICLLGLIGDKQAKTFVSDINISLIDNKLLELFSKQEYIIYSDESYHKSYVRKTALINNVDSHDIYHLFYDPFFTKFTSEKYVIASRQLKILFDENNKEFQIDSGDLLIFNNKISAHKRSNFNPLYSDTDRWVQRIMIL